VFFKLFSLDVALISFSSPSPFFFFIPSLENGLHQQPVARAGKGVPLQQVLVQTQKD
jgi:hypothetical protein